MSPRPSSYFRRALEWVNPVTVIRTAPPEIRTATFSLCLWVLALLAGSLLVSPLVLLATASVLTVATMFCIFEVLTRLPRAELLKTVTGTAFRPESHAVRAVVLYGFVVLQVLVVLALFALFALLALGMVWAALDWRTLLAAVLVLAASRLAWVNLFRPRS